MTASAHLRGIVIAGALAALALALGFVTLAMNQTASRASTHIILPLKARHHHATTKAKPAAVKRVDPNLAAALAAGLPASVARALAAAPVAVVELTSDADPIAKLAAGEARSGAALAGASYVEVSVDHDGAVVAAMTRLVGTLPQTPAALVYARPGTLFVTLNGFNDRTAVQQAAASAALTAQGTTTVSAVSDWATRAGALCRRADAQIGALGGAARPTALAAHKVKFEAAATGFLARLKALPAPAGQKVAVIRLNTLLAKRFAAQDAMVAAAGAGNVKAVAAARARGAALGPQLEKLEQQLGATGCAGVGA